MGDLGDLCCFYPHGVQIIETVILEAGQYDQGPLSYTTNLKCASNRASFTLISRSCHMALTKLFQPPINLSNN